MSDLVLKTDVPDTFAAQMQMAEVLAGSSLLPSHLRGRPENVLVIMQGARALNIPAFWAFQAMFVVDGRLSMSADLMKALVLGAGHKWRVVERTAVKAVVEIHRKDRDDPYRAEFTWDDAKTAKLTGKDNWTKYPKAMLVARAASIAVRDECPEVLFGVIYTPDELGAVTDDEGVPVDDDRVIQMPDPDKVADLALELSQLTVDNFAAGWKAVVDLGWALEKISGTDLSLADHAVDCLYVLASTGNLDTVKAVWRTALDAGLIGLRVTRVDGDTKLADYLKRRGDDLIAFGKARKLADESAKITAEVVDTPNAEALREAAAASWGDAAEDQAPGAKGVVHA